MAGEATEAAQAAANATDAALTEIQSEANDRVAAVTQQAQADIDTANAAAAEIARAAMNTNLGDRLQSVAAKQEAHEAWQMATDQRIAETQTAIAQSTLILQGLAERLLAGNSSSTPAKSQEPAQEPGQPTSSPSGADAPKAPPTQEETPPAEKRRGKYRI